MTEHVRHEHDGQGTRKPHAVQLVFSTWSRRYVGIVVEPGYGQCSGTDGTLADALKLELERAERGDRMKGPPKKALRLFNPFFVRSRWDLFIEDEDLDSLKALGERPGKRDVLSGLIEATVTHFDRVSEKLITGNVLVRRWMKSLGSDHTHADRQRSDGQRGVRSQPRGEHGQSLLHHVWKDAVFRVTDIPRERGLV
jgi:hypothetical protein